MKPRGERQEGSCELAALKQAARGATHTVNAATDDPVAAIRDLTRGGVETAFERSATSASSRKLLPRPAVAAAP